MESHSKTCSTCKETKPRTEFSVCRKAKDGLQYKCKACNKQYFKQYYQENREQNLEYKKQYYQENREQKLEYFKQYRQKNREQNLEYSKQYRQKNREQMLEYSKQYYQENREQKLEYSKQYYQENREQKLEYSKQYLKQWYKENPEKRAANSAKYRALKRESIPEALANCPEEKDRVDKIYKLRGLLTKATGIEYHVDHIWPLSKGGPHWSGNLQILTAEENLSKHASFCEDTARVIEESLHEYLSARQ